MPDKEKDLHNLHSKSSEQQDMQNAFKKEKANINKPFKMVQDSNTLIADDIQNRSQFGQIQEEMDSESQEQEIQKQARDIVKELQKKQHNKSANAKMVVGTGFSFDITEFFKFQKKKKIGSKQGDLFADISGGIFAWIILLYSVLNASMIPAWIMNIKATKLLRISWRFLLQSLMIIPFVLYERRIGNEQVKHQYSFWHIIKPAHLKKVYLSSVATSFWFTCILTVFEWTYISHGLILGSLSNFFLSIFRSRNNSNHDLEPGGQVLVVLGIALVIYDSYTLRPELASEADLNVINPFYLDRHWWQRVLADLIALVVSFSMAKFSQYTSDMKGHYPPYLSMFLVNIFMCINMIFSTYFFNGATFDYDINYGILSIFTQQHFGSFLYMSIILCFGMFISFVLISKLFSDPIIPALAMTLDPVLASFLVEVFGVQSMPNAFSFVGYLLIIPGLLLILIGQCLFQRIKSKQIEQKAVQNQKAKEIFKEVRQMKSLKSINDKKIKVKKVQAMKGSLDTQMMVRRSQDIISSQQSRRKVSSKKSLNEPFISSQFSEEDHLREDSKKK